MEMNRGANKQRSQRTKKPTAKVLESADSWQSRKPAPLTNWFKVYCEEDNRCHIVNWRSLQAIDCDHLTETDLVKGQPVLLKLKGLKYSATIVAIYDEKPDVAVAKKRPRAARYDEDSSSEDEVQVKKMKNTHTKTNTRVEKLVEPFSESELDEPEPAGTPPTPKSFSCSCREEISTLSKAVTSVIKNLSETSTKIDKMYAFLKQQKSAAVKSTIATSSATPNALIIKDEEDEKFVSDKGVNLISIRSADPAKYALALMDALFDDDEMASCCFATSKRSTKPGLPQANVTLMEACIDKKYGPGTMVQNEAIIKRKCNQKCIDVCNKRMKKLKQEKENENPSQN